MNNLGRQFTNIEGGVVIQTSVQEIVKLRLWDLINISKGFLNLVNSPSDADGWLCLLAIQCYKRILQIYRGGEVVGVGVSFQNASDNEFLVRQPSRVGLPTGC